MTKINQIISYLETEKADVAVVSDPVTINYLTGFYSDPHERQMFLFIFTNHEPLLFVPALLILRLSVMLTRKTLGKKSKQPCQRAVSETLLLNLIT